MSLKTAFGGQLVVPQCCHGLDADKTKFAKRAIAGEEFWATDTKKLYIAKTTAGAVDSKLLKFNPTETGQ